MKELIRLFKAVEIKTNRKKKASNRLLEITIKKGIVFSPEVVFNYPENELIALANNIGLSPEQLNSSFHKSWEKIKTADIEQLVLEQIVHYFTTYGFELFGVYSPDSVYIPNEKLEIPEITKGVTLTVIRGYKKKEIKEKLIKLLKTGLALHEDTIKDVVFISKQVGIDHDNINDIKNKEVKAALLDHLKLFPENPVEFLRYLVFKATGNTLLIKNAATIEGIRTSSGLKEIHGLLIRYKKEYGLERLAEIFLRFKPLFLAFKYSNATRPIINKIRKFAAKNHKARPADYLNDITAMIKHGVKINQAELRKHLNKASSFRKIRLAYALKYRTKDVDSILYRIRNGKGFATDFYFRKPEEAKRILGVVLDSLVKDIEKNVKGKTIYIPDNIKYALPATEKQFTGMFPSGTCITVPKDMMFGINWNNVNGNRIDLDLSLISPVSGKIGWDSSYRTDDRAILFSGDMTDAHGENGATELFYVKRQIKQGLIMFVNYYNYDADVEVPFKIIVAKQRASNFKINYMVNPNNVVSIANSKITEKQKMLGLLITTSKECRFYFAESSVGKSITSGTTEHAENSRKYLFSFYQNTITLNDLLEKAGAKIKNNADNCDINLSPEIIEKDTIIGLLANLKE